MIVSLYVFTNVVTIWNPVKIYKRAFIGLPAKHHLNGVSLVSQWWPDTVCWLYRFWYILYFTVISCLYDSTLDMCLPILWPFANWLNIMFAKLNVELKSVCQYMFCWYFFQFSRPDAREYSLHPLLHTSLYGSHLRWEAPVGSPSC